MVIKSLIAMVLLTMLSYFYFLNTAAFNAAAYDGLSEQISATNSVVGELELDFIEKNQAITKDMSDDFGLVTISESDITFAEKDTSITLSINE